MEIFLGGMIILSEIKFQLKGLSADQIVCQMKSVCPEVEDVLTAVREHIPPYKREVWYYQAALLYVLTQQYNFDGANILEIGTALGYTASVMALAAPKAQIITLNPKENEVPIARKNVSRYTNVTIIQEKSWDYLATYGGPKLDLLFVDGDHKRIQLDLPWWNWLEKGGLFFHHDFAPLGSARECLPVFYTLSGFAAGLGRPFDVVVMDDKKVGMVGFYKEK